jgi:NADP-dependent 3-hydroxy acid dehydrogenase YdfG
MNSGMKRPLIVAIGAASGIGAACARLLSNEGNIVGLIDRNAEGLAKVAAEIQSTGGEAFISGVDLLDDAATVKAIDALPPRGSDEVFWPPAAITLLLGSRSDAASCPKNGDANY